MRATGHVFIATSIDGFIARPNGNIDWLTKFATGNEDTGYNAFVDSIDGVVIGRGTFETALSFGTWPFNKPVVVVSQTLTQSKLRTDLRAKVRFSRLSPKPLMDELAINGWRRVYVDGGNVIQSFLKEELISE